MDHVCFACLRICDCPAVFASDCTLCATCIADAEFIDAVFGGQIRATGTPAEMPEPEPVPVGVLTETPMFANPVDEWLHRR